MGVKVLQSPKGRKKTANKLEIVMNKISKEILKPKQFNKIIKINK